MKKIFKNSLYMLVAGALVASCADYNDMNGFKADPDPSVVDPYKDLATVNSYIDRTANPNLEIGTALDITEFNKQQLAHCAAIGNFDCVSFGKNLMSKTIVSSTGVMNFVSLMDLLEHMDEIGGKVYGSPIVANTEQCDEWIKTLISPIEIAVESEMIKVVDYNTYPTGAFPGTVESGKPTIEKYDNQNALKIPTRSKVRIVEDFEIKPNATYTITFWARSDKNASYNVKFAGTNVEGTGTSDGKWAFPAGKWTKVTVISKTPEGATDGYLTIENSNAGIIYVNKVQVEYTPDNHRPQTAQEISDTIRYALDTWCDGLMNINKGRIKQFDLIDEPLDKAVLDNGMYDIKHGTANTIFWQDILGSENYAPEVARVARNAFEKYEGNVEGLKFFISETGLEDTKKMESLNYWIGIWDAKGAKIDGINAKVNLVFYEDAAKQAENKAAYEALLANLAKTGKLVRISNFDIKYIDANNLSVQTAKITDEQRQMLADYNAYALKAYMSMIPHDKQAGISKANILDSGDPVGLWTKLSSGDWARTATYKAWCDALSGK